MKIEKKRKNRTKMNKYCTKNENWKKKEKSNKNENPKKMDRLQFCLGYCSTGQYFGNSWKSGPAAYFLISEIRSKEKDFFQITNCKKLFTAAFLPQGQIYQTKKVQKLMLQRNFDQKYFFLQKVKYWSQVNGEIFSSDWQTTQVQNFSKANPIFFKIKLTTLDKNFDFWPIFPFLTKISFFD